MAEQVRGVIVKVGYFDEECPWEMKFPHSCSGILLSEKHGLVLSSGWLLSSYLRAVNSKLNARKQEQSSGIISKMSEWIGSKDKGKIKGNKLFSLKTLLVKSRWFIITESKNARGSGDRITEKHTAKFVGIWKNKELFENIRKLLKDNWKQSKDFNPQMLAIGSFVLFQMYEQNDTSIDSLSTIRHILQESLTQTAKVGQGEKVWCESSLFGDFSPAVFLNSLSGGIVVNQFGSVIITDARCAPGSEGGLLFVQRENGKRLWVGMIVISLSWKQKELLGLSLACSADKIIGSILEKRHLPILPSIKAACESNHLSSALQSVVTVKLGASWGSGTIIDKDKKIIITCAHVVKTASTVSVELHYPILQECTARVVYRTPEGSVPDIAVLQLPSDVQVNQQLTYTGQRPRQGEDVFAAGFAIFPPYCRTGVHVTSGVISKVVSLYDIPVMVQTSCFVFGGASGGVILSAESGNGLALIVCNAKDTKLEVTYPLINLAVPFAAIFPTLQKYLQTGDEAVLHSLESHDANTKELWKLGKIRTLIPSQL